MESLWSLFVIYVIASVVGALMRRSQTPARPRPEVDPEEILRRWAQRESPPQPVEEPEPAAAPIQVEPRVVLPEPEAAPPLPAAAGPSALPLGRRQLLRGVIWGEILRPPRALRRYRPFDW